MTLLDGTGWQLMVWWCLKKLVITLGLGRGESGFLWRDYCAATERWDPKWAAGSVELVIKSGLGKERALPMETGQQKVRGMCTFHHLQALSYCLALATAAQGSIKHPLTCCRSRNANLHLVLLFSIHNRPLLWLMLDNIIYSICCQNVCKNVKELMKPSLYLSITWSKKKKKGDEIVLGKWGGKKLEIKV